MASVYIDIIENIEFLLFDESLNVLDSFQGNEKPSKSLHYELNLFLKNNGIEKNQVNYIFNKGPGSYTGLRLLQGFEDILRMEGLACFDLYSFEVLKYLSEDKKWRSFAFKKEDFLCEYTDGKFQYKLVEENESALKSESFITHHNFKNDESAFRQLLQDSLASDVEKKIFYYRSIEEEFRRA